MPKLITAVFVRDPDRHRTVLLQPGEEPEPRLAALVTNPDCWEDGKLPEPVEAPDGDNTDGDSADDSSKPEADPETDKAAPAAKKPAARKPAAPKPARSRTAAAEGVSGE
jgi:hypothetical protein